MAGRTGGEMAAQRVVSLADSKAAKKVDWMVCLAAASMADKLVVLMVDLKAELKGKNTVGKKVVS